MLKKYNVLTLIFGVALFLLENSLGLASWGLITGFTTSVNVLCKDPELVVIARRQVSHWHQGEPGVSNPCPAGHWELLLLNDVVGDS